MKKTSHRISDTLWDLWCILSIIGIWPRFIEPNLLQKKAIRLPIENLPDPLQQLKILHLSDLHLHLGVSDHFLKRIIQATKDFSPDLIVFTGDFLCYAQFGDKERTLSFLNSFKAPLGCYAVLGNHDYAKAVALSEEGKYDISESSNSLVKKGFQRLFSKLEPPFQVSERAKALGYHDELLALLKETPFKLLDNCSIKIPIQDTFLNIVGLGEYSLGRNLPEQAFKEYDDHYPGLILTHNPDSIPLLQNYHGDIILSGHTHGGQINLPWVWKKLTLMEHPEYKQGLHRVDKKWLYVSRGIGSVVQFRWFSIPEIALITLERKT